MTETATAARDSGGKPLEIKCSILGSEGTTVTLTGEGTVQDVVLAAAKQIGVTVDPERVAFVKNGEQVVPDTPVADQDIVTAAGKVNNG